MAVRYEEASKPFGRGVYRADWLSEEGFPILVALSRDGRKVVERTFYPFEEFEDVAREVWSNLHRIDPVGRGGPPWQSYDEEADRG